MALMIGNTIDPRTGFKRPLPMEYVMYFMMRYVYHCDPIRLAEIPYPRILLDWEIAQYELEREAQQRSK